MTLAQWLDDNLAAHGITRTAAPELWRERAWATVYRVPTDAGSVWLKVMPPATAYEAQLYKPLVRHASPWVLDPLGDDAERGWLLLPDAGPSVLARQAEDELPMALHTYGKLQLALAPHVDELLAAGSPDMRPELMPERFDEAMAYAGRYARRTREDLGDLVALRPRYLDWCAELVAYGRPATIDHNDLHVENVVGTAARPRFYDWGDSVVAHPFACLLTPIDTTPPATHGQLWTTYLGAFGDARALRGEAELARRVALVARSLVWLRALGDRPETHEHAGAPLVYLRMLLV